MAPLILRLDRRGGCQCSSRVASLDRLGLGGRQFETNRLWTFKKPDVI